MKCIGFTDSMNRCISSNFSATSHKLNTSLRFRFSYLQVSLMYVHFCVILNFEVKSKFRIFAFKARFIKIYTERSIILPYWGNIPLKLANTPRVPMCHHVRRGGEAGITRGAARSQTMMTSVWDLATRQSLFPESDCKRRTAQRENWIFSFLKTVKKEREILKGEKLELTANQPSPLESILHNLPIIRVKSSNSDIFIFWEKSVEVGHRVAFLINFRI